MEAKTKRNLIIWSIVFLVLLNISSLGTIWFHRYQFRHNKMNRNFIDKTKDERSRGTRRHRLASTAGFTSGLDLTDLQQQKFDSIWRYYNDIRQDIEDEMETNRQKMGKIMSEEEIDTSSFYRLSSLQTKLMATLDRTMIDMNLAFRSNLNPEQKTVFLQRIEKINKRKSMRHVAPRKRKSKN